MDPTGMSPDGPEWDPYNASYSNQEASMIDFKGNIIIQEPKKQRIFDDRGEFEHSISEKQCEAAISAIVANNSGNPQDDFV